MKEDGKLRAIVTIEDSEVRSLIRGQVKHVLRDDEAIKELLSETIGSEIKRRTFALMGGNYPLQWIKNEIREVVREELRNMGMRAQIMIFVKEFMYELLNPKQKNQEAIKELFQEEVAILLKEKEVSANPDRTNAFNGHDDNQI